jgi:hypothetical protein
MSKKLKKIIWVMFFALLLNFFHYASRATKINDKEETIINAMHSISSHTLFDYVVELCREEYQGRLTGTDAFNKAAAWVAKFLKEREIKPGGDNKSYLQAFLNPYTLVFKGSEVKMHLPLKNGEILNKIYQYEKDFLPGSTSDSGEVTAEVVYVGYGITAPELDFDEYKGMDVKGKIVLMEREVPISPKDHPREFKKWRPYSFHQYKVKNAKKHGAVGMLYNYHIANPNCQFLKNLILTYIGPSIVKDIFLGTGKRHAEIKKKIQSTRKPQSFSTGKIFTIKNETEHHPEGIAFNVIGYLEGTNLKDEGIIIGAHLDHVGKNHLMMPGANDNASGVAVVLSIAETMAKLPIHPKRTIIFILFGAEEQGVKGSQYYLENPLIPNKKVIAFINLDGVGRGKKINALAAENFPELWSHFKKANQQFIHRSISTTHFHNLARPRLDAARFMWAGIPSVSFSTYGADELPYSIYHKTLDKPDIITPEIMEDLAQMIFLAVVDLAGY